MEYLKRQKVLISICLTLSLALFVVGLVNFALLWLKIILCVSFGLAVCIVGYLILIEKPNKMKKIK